MKMVKAYFQYRWLPPVRHIKGERKRIEKRKKKRMDEKIAKDKRIFAEYPWEGKPGHPSQGRRGVNSRCPRGKAKQSGGSR
ncbi:MAG: hypothetical protein ACPLXA_10305 [Moorellaceae bacterium]